jgi:hypothetical protein
MIATANTLPNVCFGSLADIAAAGSIVRFTPRKQTCERTTRVSAMCQDRKWPTSLDHLVGAGEQAFWRS